VGSGPNGLAAAARLADAGASVLVLEAGDTIGGGTRSADDLTVPGVVHDICSAFHPLGLASPYLSTLDLAPHGLAWAHPEIQLAHPLDDGPPGVLHRGVDRTAVELGEDAGTWRSLFGPFEGRLDELADDLLRPLLRVPRHPLLTARLGLPSLLPATTLARGLETPRARALLAGIAAHAFLPLDAPLSGAFAMLLGVAGHEVGWPVAVGGSQTIADALVSYLAARGVEVRTGERVTSLRDLPPTRTALFDVTPRQLLAIAGDRLPPRTRRAFERWRYGPAAFKLDLAVEGAVPWRDDACRRAGTLHLGGTLEEIAAAEADVTAGRMPERPYVLVGQQHLADPSRSAGDVHPLWAYAHVPHGFSGDATGAILAQLERFAPGLRDRIVAQHVWTPAALEAHDANYVGGDIAGGAHGGLQLIGRPRLALDPYRTGIRGVFLCSSSTPPGGGVHGMCGFHAAGSALRILG
jgi:phytoene dehydrogenase-like protein